MKALCVPARHGRQAVLEVAPGSGLKVPGGHRRHEAWPGSSWKRPEGHGRHWAAALAGCQVPGGQGLQAETEVEAMCGLEVPLGHLKQKDWADEGW